MILLLAETFIETYIISSNGLMMYIPNKMNSPRKINPNIAEKRNNFPPSSSKCVKERVYKAGAVSMLTIMSNNDESRGRLKISISEKRNDNNTI
jgi:hypothetical protein